ncbi:MAG: hypothetical protein V3T22_05895 [Planctomycetota bacterium]
MKIHEYWSRGSAAVERDGRSWKVVCFGASDESAEDAVRAAEEAAKRAARAIRAGEARDGYAYAERPLREELVEELEHAGERTAAITRNSYGSLVLNTESGMFVDIDYPPRGSFSALRRACGRLFGRQVPSRDERIRTRVRDVVGSTPGLGLRLYRTANGYRCLVTSRAYDPASREARELLERFGCDPLYILLCQAQECFRARLSPKFWRCGAPRPPFRFPWLDGERERLYREWQARYKECTRSFRTCSFVETVGSTKVLESLERIVRVHDRSACDGNGPLA